MYHAVNHQSKSEAETLIQFSDSAFFPVEDSIYYLFSLRV